MLIGRPEASREFPTYFAGKGTRYSLKNHSSFRTLTYLSLFGLAITVPLLLLLGALLLQSASVRSGRLEDRVIQVLDALVSNLDRDLDRDITILRTLATSQAFASADWPTFYTQAKAGLQGRAYLVLIDSDGRQLVNTYVPYGKQPARTGDPETLRRIVQTKEPVVSNLFVSLVVKKPVFNVSIPILRDGQVRYVLSLGLLADDLVVLLNSQQVEPWVTTLWDAKGVILARSRDQNRFVGTALPENLRKRDQRVVRTTNLDGMDVLHAAARSRVSGWGVGVNVPYSAIARELRGSLLIWGGASAFAIAIALALGLLFTRRITLSLSVAAKAAAAFGQGEPFPSTGSGLKEVDALLITLKEAQQAREKMTEAVRQSRDWLQTTLNSIGDGVITTDANGNVTLFNAVAQSLTGWKQEEAAGKPLKQVFVIRDALTGLEIEIPVAAMARESRIVGAGDHAQLVARDGRQIPIDASAAPIRKSGEVEGLVLVFRDIAERLKAEERLRLTVEAAPNAMIMAGRDGRIELVNSQTEKLFGYGRDELLGRPIEMLMPDRYRGGHGSLRDSFLRQPSARPMGAGRDLFGLCKDGREVPIEIGLNPISTSQGDFILAAIIDISERKKAEETLRNANAALQAANLRLSDLDKLKTEFVANVSHDFRTPLASIRGFAETLLRGALDDAGDRVDFTRTILRNADRLTRLVEDVLLLSKLDSGKLGAEPESINLRDFLDDYSLEIQPLLRSHGTELQLRVEQDIIVWADAHHLGTVFQNLVTNAIKYNRRGGWVRLSADRRDGKVLISVKDSGMGIDSKHLPHVFERFYRADKARRDTGDSGLGLSIVQRLIEGSGNKIWVNSVVGKGTTFHFTLDAPASGTAA
jgi:PAS domain S-box-containing protein